MSHSLLLIALIALPFAGSLVAGLLPANARNAEAWLAGAVALAGLVATATLFPAVTGGGVVRHETPWLPQLGLGFVLRLDGFAWLLAALVTGIGFLVVLYARYYMSPSDPVPRFFSFLLAFMGSMLGVVLSGNLVQLAFFWELTGLLSFLLIGYWHHSAAARDGARMALIVTGTGGLCLLAGILVLGHIVGSYDLDAVLAAGDRIRAHPLYLTALILILLGALTKSAQFPFHFWLPHAMAAPTPVSAYLHSATMVKLGVFLLARLWPALAGTDAWTWLVGTAGLATLLLGAHVAIFQQDLKGLLAYSTISHLGLVTLLLGLNSPLAAVAGIFHIMNHAAFKASLFMAAGIIDHEAGTRDIRRLSGLYRLMPITATLAMVASAAMAGVPLLNGFLSKEMFFAESLEATAPVPLLEGALPFAATLWGVFSVAYSLRFIHGAFFGPPPTSLPRVPHEPPHWMRFPIEFLVVVCIVVGVVPGIAVGRFLDAAARAVLGTSMPAFDLRVWHGFTLPLLMSVVATAGGVALYLALRRSLDGFPDGPPLVRRLKGQRLFERVLVTVSIQWARSLERLLGTRRLQPQLQLLACAAILAALSTGPLRWPEWDSLDLSGVDPVLALLWVVGIACAVSGAVLAKFHRLAALMLTGGAGLVTCLTFVWLSAPDLALTQLLVEIVTTILILLGLRWLPKRLPDAGLDGRETPAARARRLRDLAIAVVAGAGLAMLAFATMTRQAPDAISGYFLAHAYTGGGGTNVVNVILVDFRGFDTLGEITVLGVVSLTVFALLRRFRPAQDSIAVPEQQRLQSGAHAAAADFLTIPAVIMHLLFPVIAVMALFLFLRGHDLPGGGFVAGITMTVAFIVQYMAGGIRLVEARLRILPVRWIALGLLLAAGTGAGSWLFSYPFLTSASAYVRLPAIGAVPLASAMLFDLGVFSLVVGSTTLILVALARQSIRSHRAPRLDALRET